MYTQPWAASIATTCVPIATHTRGGMPAVLAPPCRPSYQPSLAVHSQVRKVKEGVVCGFAGATADAMTLFERLEMKLSEHPETLRACVEMV